MSQTVYLNGRLLPLEQAQVSVLDRGFVFGDGIYEVIPVYSRQPFRLREHLQRLNSSLQAIQLVNPHTTEQWEAIISQLMAENSWQDQAIYLQITRGMAPRNHAFPTQVTPTIFMMCSQLVTPSAAQIASGASAISTSDIRWSRCDIKTIALLPNVLFRQMAVEAGVDEVILFRDGILTEGAASNIFAVEDGTLLAPPKDQYMLPGITYDLILELAAAQKIPTSIGKFTASRIRAVDELWLTSSVMEILAVVQLDGRSIGNGKVGPLFQSMYQQYQTYKNEVMRRG